MKPSDVLVVGPNVGVNAANSEVPRTCAEPSTAASVIIVTIEFVPAAKFVTVTKPVELIATKTELVAVPLHEKAPL